MYFLLDLKSAYPQSVPTGGDDRNLVASTDANACSVHST